LIITANRAVDLPQQSFTPNTPSLRRIDPARVSGPSPDVARALLGTFLVREHEGTRLVVRIVETEAYAGPEDRASHARAGKTPRTAVMFGPPGIAYVYLVYGMHHCMNVVSGTDQDASAVLIRAVEPISGVETMRARRGATAATDERLGAGPARLCQALGIDRDLGGLDLLRGDRLWLAIDPDAGEVDAAGISVGPRIGVAYAGPDWAQRPWRFGIAGHPSLSRPFPSGE
jgi:DNA-3-methyladenine glycosylase